jgi:hypothetical protein
MVLTGPGASTDVNFRPRLNVNAAHWVLDATEHAEPVIDDEGHAGTFYTYDGGSAFFDGALVQVRDPVVLSIPEPAALGLAALGSGLLARRRERSPAVTD